tara:strand:+ start:127 stop:609 length:483 start_codon:yes stop_codon:yes gene_type:complete
LIEKNRPRRKKPRINKNRTPNQLRTFETKGINTPKTRGAISKALEKYTSLAQDAFSNGDRIVAESYYQFAEHYQRVLNENFEDHKSDNINSRFRKNNEIDVKPSRTERAISATNERNKSSKNNINSADNQSGQKFSFEDQKNEKKEITSDGIEALKPFEI